ncbi:unnamed protein product [Spirodela intermedia]|uniref:Uncharacterized protein n=1 Tax=Spirodela intermedia TaxID=51605 RepID=A0A7I8K675_SPIIN|nr:unnamed protein product [Spirodela intermedia]
MWKGGDAHVPHQPLTIDWPPVTWKGSGTHVPLSVQAARAPAHSYSPTKLPTRRRLQSKGVIYRISKNFI